jgi:hypothetical protein
MSDRKSFLLRIDAELWADLEAWAQDELRSVNGQIEYLLRQAVNRRRGESETGGETEARRSSRRGVGDKRK